MQKILVHKNNLLKSVLLSLLTSYVAYVRYSYV